jgi:alpha-beta hydrolase superfamily lysophospholipase
MRGIWALAPLLLLAGCASLPAATDVLPVDRPVLRYEPLGTPEATVVALHGFNDRKAAFLPFGAAAAAAGIRVLAYDQGGFGANADAGAWPGAAQLVADLHATIREARALAPGAPVVVLGESMGAAVALAALADPAAPPVDGLVLAAPAVWAGDQLNPLFRMALWLTAAIAPEADFTGRGLEIQASDNIPMLMALGRDPLYLPQARAEALLGLVRIMDRGIEAAPGLTQPRLVLLGRKDEVVPARAVDAFLATLAPERCTVVRYPEGWHLLLRDLGREVVIADILAWIEGRALPSRLATACGPRLEVAEAGQPAANAGHE